MGVRRVAFPVCTKPCCRDRMGRCSFWAIPTHSVQGMMCCRCPLMLVWSSGPSRHLPVVPTMREKAEFIVPTDNMFHRSAKHPASKLVDGNSNAKDFLGSVRWLIVCKIKLNAKRKILFRKKLECWKHCVTSYFTHSSLKNFGWKKIWFFFPIWKYFWRLWSKHIKPIFRLSSEFTVLQRQETQTGTQESAWYVLIFRPTFQLYSGGSRLHFTCLSFLLMRKSFPEKCTEGTKGSCIRIFATSTLLPEASTETGLKSWGFPVVQSHESSIWVGRHTAKTQVQRDSLQESVLKIQLCVKKKEKIYTNAHTQKRNRLESILCDCVQSVLSICSKASFGRG